MGTDRPEPLQPQSGGGEATFYAKSRLAAASSDLQVCVAEIPSASEESAARFGLLEYGFTMCGGVVQPSKAGSCPAT